MANAPMSPAVADAIDMDADYTAELAINASPDAVFDALTTIAGLAAWWAPVTGSGLTDGELRFAFVDDIPLIMHVTAAHRPTTVQWACVQGHPLPDWTGTTLSFQMQPRPDGGCDLQFRHIGLTPRVACYRDCKDGWDHCLPSLRAFVEAGQGSPRGSQADLQWREEDKAIESAAR